MSADYLKLYTLNKYSVLHEKSVCFEYETKLSSMYHLYNSMLVEMNPALSM